jgi:hypothetical protein
VPTVSTSEIPDSPVLSRHGQEKEAPSKPIPTKRTLAELSADSRRLTAQADKLIQQMATLKERIDEARQIQERAKDSI